MPARRRFPRIRLLAGLRIRRKLVVLHTVFSLGLALILLLALKPAIERVVREAEAHEGATILAHILATRAGGPNDGAPVHDQAGVSVRYGGPGVVGIDEAAADRARDSGEVVTHTPSVGPTVIAAYEPATGQYIGVSVTLAEARKAVVRLYVVLTLALLAVYGLVAAALEVFVLPQHVYRPIRTILTADAALQSGRAGGELIPPAAIPEDELGEIMRSRNESIRALRRHEHELAGALARLEEVANDLARKNHLLEMARRNLADADRLASLGMMSAGIAHELNTPLTVLKGLVEKLAPSRGPGLSHDERELLVRVVSRLERLSESLLDFARARPSKAAPTLLRPLAEEAWTLVRLDREAGEVELRLDVPASLRGYCDGDRIVQVLVNLLRNAVDAMDEAGPEHGVRRPRIVVTGASSVREGEEWAVLTIVDNGPGIDAEVLGRLFQPFVSTRLDAKGSGLGLAVAEGIVREQGGVLLGRNRVDAPGAIFEIVLRAAGAASGNGPEGVTVHSPQTLPGASA